MKGLRLFVALLLLSAPLSQPFASMLELPVIYDYRELGFVPVRIAGNQVQSIDASVLATVLSPHLLPEAVSNLRALGVSELNATEEFGVSIAFRPNTFDLIVTLQTTVMGSTEVDFGVNPVHSGAQVRPAQFALFNSVNLGVEHNIESEYTAVVGDLYTSINVGGAQGVNLINTVGASYEPEFDEQSFYRAETTLFYDNTNWPLRVEAGDVSSLPSGHLPALNKGGVSISSSFELLQPTRRISPTSRQELIIRERAEIEVYVNGLEIGRYRVTPGRYNLNDLPLGEGTNDIEIIVLYASGDYEVQRFSQFHTAQLLRRGITDFSLSAGYLSDFNLESGLNYGDDLVYSGYIEHGLFDWLTLGINAQYSDFGRIYGLSSVIGSPVGNLSARFSTSETEWFESGSAYSFEWQQRVFGAHRFGSPNLRVLYEHYDNFIATPWIPSFLAFSGERALVSYSAFVADSFQLNVSYLQSTLDDFSNRNESEVRGIYRWRGFRFGAGYRRVELTDLEQIDQEIFFNLAYQLNRPRAQQRYRASYDSLSERAQFEVARNTRNHIGDYSYQLGHVDAPANDLTYGSLGYTANRARFGVFGERRMAGDQEFSKVGANLNTAFGWAGSSFGWGHGGAGPFAVVKPHRTLDQSNVYVNESLRGTEARSSKLGGALLTTRPRHMNSVFTINVPDAPLGYDWGGGQYVLKSGAVTGANVIVGSDASYSVIGRLVDHSEKGLVLQAAMLVGEGLEKTLFTNSAGRFVVEGLKPGNYLITLSADQSITYTLEIPESEDVLVRAGNLQPLD